MKLSGLLILLGFQLLGEAIAQISGVAIPGPVIGLVLLFIALIIRGGPSEELAATSQGMIGLLPLLLITPSAGLFFLGSGFNSQWPAFFGAVIIGTIIAFCFAALLMKTLLGKRHD